MITLLGFVHCGFARAQEIFGRRTVLLGGKRFSVPMDDIPMFACGFYHDPLKFLAPAAVVVTRRMLQIFARRIAGDYSCTR